jgi:serine/threonine-protein kinase RsbW
MTAPSSGSQKPNRSLGDPWHEERVRSTGEVSALCDRLTTLMAQAGFSDKDLFAMRLALEEAVVNAIRHGNGGDPGKTVRVRYHVNASEALAEVEDQGPGFNPAGVPDPLAPENLESPSGRGIFLIRHYMSWVKFNDRGNCVTFCKERA